MSEPGTPADRRPDEERSASFDELMRLERSQHRPPVSGLAVAALGFAVAFTGLAVFFGAFALVVGAAALVFGVFALPQIKHRERRGFGFVLAALAVLVVGVVFIESVMNLLD
ncbi:hypothetical protein [Actinophytocola algeriensis]|uniref:DUF4190 domain-containing protein n=1 Tax=Actinophytocola algeriensis TaxID=1768010 RepID=A0A7W7Q2Y2_9PSEU|nr:hypothetical protein [Actinophytocola algeriensis]MBB4906051.1 hypothetical protein [Actinophytocola algeriensis]MBE1472264.1 hypothetical protein [Actinophytocola algeriensis]